MSEAAALGAEAARYQAADGQVVAETSISPAATTHVLFVHAIAPKVPGAYT